MAGPDRPRRARPLHRRVSRHARCPVPPARMRTWRRRTSRVSVVGAFDSAWTVPTPAMRPHASSLARPSTSARSLRRKCRHAGSCVFFAPRSASAMPNTTSTAGSVPRSAGDAWRPVRRYCTPSGSAIAGGGQRPLSGSVGGSNTRLARADGLSQITRVASLRDPSSGAVRFGFYVAAWVVMMAAMMFPSIWPMVTMYSRIQDRERKGDAHSGPGGRTNTTRSP